MKGPDDALYDWGHLIEDGDWAVKEAWADFNGMALLGAQHGKPTPERIQQFMAWLIRGGGSFESGVELVGFEDK